MGKSTFMDQIASAKKDAVKLRAFMGQSAKVASLYELNVEQGKTSLWIDKKCARCGAGPRQAILNIEAIIHHNAKQLICVDHVECKKRAKKKAK